MASPRGNVHHRPDGPQRGADLDGRIVRGQTVNRPIPFTVIFSEAVTGFSDAGLTVSNGTVTDFATISSSQYSFNVVPAANGLVTALVKENAATDGAGNGNLASSSFSITYRPPVTLAGLAVSPSAACVGRPVTVTATVGRDTGSYSYTLTYGNSTLTGNTPNAFSQTLTAIGSGQQTISLRVSNGVDDFSQNTSLTVNPLPTVSLSSSGMLTCAQPSVTLTATGNGMGQSLTYRFSAPAGPGSNTATVTTAGDYSVTAITTSGCSATATPTLLTQTGQPYPVGRPSRLVLTPVT